MLVVHGAGGGFDQGLDFSKGLSANGFRLIVVSRFGYLRTPLPADASPAAQADAYACLLDALDIKRVAVVGLSAGGPSSMQFALRHPERTTALVLLVPAAYPTHQARTPEAAMPKQGSAVVRFLVDGLLRSDFLLWAGLRLAPEAMMRAVLATPPEVVRSTSADERARAAEVLDHLLPFSQRRLGVLNDAAITPVVPRYDLERIEAPTLILGAVDDLYGTYDRARYSAEHIPNARFVAYPSGGHVLIGRLRAATTEIVTFLAARR